MIPLRAIPGETAEQHMHRWGTKLQRLRDQCGFSGWDADYKQNVFKWAGHMARMRQHSPLRLSCLVFKHRDWQWIQKRGTANDGNQGHGRKLRAWRWEKTMYVLFRNKSWQEAAQDKQSWGPHLESMVNGKLSAQK